MKAQLHTKTSKRMVTLPVAVVAVLCSFASAATPAQAKIGPQEYAAPAVMRIGIYAKVHPARHVLRPRTVHGNKYLPLHFMP